MSKLRITFGKSVCAYAKASVDASAIDINDRQALVDLANNSVFSPDWDTAEDLRVVSVQDEGGSYLIQDKPLESDPAGEDERCFVGSLKFPGAETLEVEFRVPHGATQEEMDLAFIQGLAQLATIGYRETGV